MPGWRNGQPEKKPLLSAAFSFAKCVPPDEWDLLFSSSSVREPLPITILLLASAGKLFNF